MHCYILGFIPISKVRGGELMNPWIWVIILIIIIGPIVAALMDKLIHIDREEREEKHFEKKGKHLNKD